MPFTAKIKRKDPFRSADQREIDAMAYLLHDIAVGAAERRDAVCAEAGLTS